MRELLVVIAVAALSSCSSLRSLMTPEEDQQYAAAVAAEDAARVELAAAQEGGDSAKIAAARAKLDAAEVETGKLETAVTKRVFGGFWASLYSIPVIGEYAKLLGPTALFVLSPLLGSRSRKHYWQFLKDLAPWVPDEQGSKGVALKDAGLSLARAYGWRHSEEKAA